MPPLGRWLAAFLLPSLLSIVVTYLVLRWYFRKDLSGSLEIPQERATLDANGKLILWGLLLVVAVLLMMSWLDKDLGLPTCIAALCVTAVVSVRKRANPWPLAGEISWPTLGLVAALFVQVNAVESIGALHLTEMLLHRAEALSTTWGAMATAFCVGVANNLINNLPLGLIAGATVNATHTHGLLANAVLIGVDLGPNLSVTGSLATILWLLALRKEGLDVGAWDFLKVGALAMPAALLASMAAALFMHAIFPNF
jgi:arsenical pump membrane protein